MGQAESGERQSSPESQHGEGERHPIKTRHAHHSALLNQRQRRLILRFRKSPKNHVIGKPRSWHKSQRTGLDNVGAKIFQKIYESDPSVGIMFGLENVPQAELKYKKRFQVGILERNGRTDTCLGTRHDIHPVVGPNRLFSRRHASSKAAMPRTGPHTRPLS